MLEKENLQKALDRFKNHVIKESKSNLTKLKKNSSKKLYNSIKGTVKVNENSFEMDFTMEDYGQFQDKGVSGKITKYPNTPYNYKSKMPPPKALDKWIVRKGIAPRQNGKFTGRTIDAVGFKKSIQFLIARKIFLHGIKPTLFFTKPFEKAYKNLPNELVKDFGLDVDKLFNFSIKQPTK
jgi:hypothetical protein